MTDRIRLGISACLLGQRVRYDGGHRLDPFLADTVGAYVDLVPVCPEVEAGMGTPRPPAHLAGDPEAPRFVTVDGDADLTDRLLPAVRRRLAALSRDGLDGFIFKERSPSCGSEAVPIHRADGTPAGGGAGLFARMFMERFPLVPVEQAEGLRDPERRERFVDAVFTLRRWRAALARGRSARGLVAFHTAHKLLIMAHSVEHYRSMGRLVADAKAAPIGTVIGDYQAMLLEALRLTATPKKRANVLMHAMGYFKRVLSADEKAELAEAIERHRAGLLPLVVPVTLINHLVRMHGEPYLAGQVFLDPHPVELLLRNHA